MTKAAELAKMGEILTDSHRLVEAKEYDYQWCNAGGTKRNKSQLVV